MNTEKDYVMYIVVNDDLKMGKGKIASQVGHCVQYIVEEIIISYYVNKKLLYINSGNIVNLNEKKLLKYNKSYFVSFKIFFMPLKFKFFLDA